MSVRVILLSRPYSETLTDRLRCVECGYSRGHDPETLRGRPKSLRDGAPDPRNKLRCSRLRSSARSGVLSGLSIARATPTQKEPAREARTGDSRHVACASKA